MHHSDNFYLTSTLYETDNPYWFIPKINRSFDITGWKIHIYGVTYTDWLNLTNLLIPFCIKHNLNHKILKPSKLEYFSTHPQKGKYFVIYTSSINQFKEIIKLLDELLLNQYPIKENQQFPQIQGDNSYGSSGRVFYRYDFNSKKYSSTILDLTKIDHLNLYNKIYESNRGELNYLASDMTEKDDILY